MAIRETIVIDVAEVEATDDYRVEVRQRKRRTQYTTEQARDLANEIIDAAERVDAAVAEDLAVRGLRLVTATITTPEGEVVL